MSESHTPGRDGSAIGSAASALADIASVLESLDRPVEQVERVLELLRRFVPYDRCALLDGDSGFGHGLLVVPSVSATELKELRHRLSSLHELLTDESAARPIPQMLTDPSNGHPHLAVPLIALDEVAGILMVEHMTQSYEAHHLQLLSVVAAQLGGYVAKLRLSSEQDKVARVTRRAADLLEHIEDGFLEFDSNGICVSANRAARELLGSDTRLVGASAAELLEAGGAHDFVGAVQRTLANRVSIRLEAEHVPEDDRWWAGDVYPTELGASLFLRDVSERRKAEELRDLLVGIIGHDLRTPLAAVTLTAETLLYKGDLSEQTTRAMSRIARSGARMSELVTQLLDLTRLRMGRTLPIRRRESDLARMVRHTVDEIARLHPDRTIQYDLEGDLTGSWDGDRLSQVISNLLDNAIKHGASDAPVRLRAWSSSAATVCLAVNNRGPTIPEDLSSSIFEAFRSRDRVESEGSTLGLGLFIARSIVEAHGGSIEVESTDEAGTTFTVELPRFERPAVAAEPPEHKHAQWRAREGEAQSADDRPDRTGDRPAH